MAQVITFAGEQLFATKAQNNQPLDIDTFIFAMVPGQDPNTPINRAEALPPIGQRVHTQIVQQTGKVNQNVVIYSTVLDSTTGPFEFNWVGLYSSVNSVLVAIQHIPTTPKTITVPGAAGNTLNRNFGIEYSGIAELAGITVEPETWQLDYTARLNGMDELTRQLAADMNGKDWFIGDGFKVEPRSTLNTFKVTAGAGYVSGLRVELEADHILTLSAYPRFVYVDAWFDGTSESVWKGQADFIVNSGELSDYLDENGKQHYLCKIALITSASSIQDLRNNVGLSEKIEKHIQKENSAHKASSISLAIKSALGNENYSVEDLANSYGISVEEFRKAAESDSEVIIKALTHIANLPFTGTRLIFQKGRQYTYDSTHYLYGINNMIIDLNGAKLIRADGQQTSSEVTALTAMNSVNIPIANASIFKAGDFVSAFTSDSDTDTSRDARKITAINGNVITITDPLGFSPALPNIPEGTVIAKRFSCFAGRPSSADSTTPLNPGINERISIINGEIDGNKDNQLNCSWRFLAEILLHSKGGLINKLLIKNVAGEAIVGHGINVKDNIFENLNGSCFHLSLHDSQSDNAGWSKFTENTVKNVNLEHEKVGHAEGMITFSWAAGNLTVTHNICKGGSAAILGGFGSRFEENPDRLLNVSDNIFEQFASIMHSLSDDAEGVHLSDNIFAYCGGPDSNNFEITLKLIKNPLCSLDNNTYIETHSVEYEKCKKSFVGSNPSKITTLNRQWVQKNDIGHVAYALSEARVLEGGGDAYLDNDDADTTTGFYSKTGSQFSDYFEKFSRLLGFKSWRGNGKNVGFEWITGWLGTGTPALRIEKDGEIHTPLKRIFNLGDRGLDSSWRLEASGSDLLIQKRVAGVWVTKSTISG